MRAGFLRVETLAGAAAAGRAERPAWRVDDLRERLVELSAERAAAQLTAAFGLVLEAQTGGDRAAWVTLASSAFFPPDAAAGGVDLESLPIVRVGAVLAAGRAAEHLVRSGGFGLVVIDLSCPLHAPAPAATLPVPLLTRLLGLARAHHTAVLILTRKPPDAASLNSLISLRADAQWSVREADGRYEVRVRALKDKRRAPGWEAVETCSGSVGMR